MCVAGLSIEAPETKCLNQSQGAGPSKGPAQKKRSNSRLTVNKWTTEYKVTWLTYDIDPADCVQLYQV